MARTKHPRRRDRSENISSRFARRRCEARGRRTRRRWKHEAIFSRVIKWQAWISGVLRFLVAALLFQPIEVRRGRCWDGAAHGALDGRTNSAGHEPVMHL